MTDTLDGVLEAVERLPVEAQEELVAVVRRRLEADVAEARREYREGKGRVVTAAELARELGT